MPSVPHVPPPVRHRSSAGRPAPPRALLVNRVATDRSLQILRALVFGVVVLVGGGSALLASHRPANCGAILLRISRAKEAYAKDRGLVSGDRVRISELIQQYLGAPPHCPAGGTYTFGLVGEPPRCSFVGHVLPADPGPAEPSPTNEH